MNDCNGQQIIWRATQSGTLDCPLQDLPVPRKEQERIQMKANERSSQFPCLHLSFSLRVIKSVFSCQGYPSRPALCSCSIILFIFFLFFFIPFFVPSFFSYLFSSFLLLFLFLLLCLFFLSILTFYLFCFDFFFFSIPPYLVWFAGSVSSDNT